MGNESSGLTYSISKLFCVSCLKLFCIACSNDIETSCLEQLSYWNINVFIQV